MTRSLFEMLGNADQERIHTQIIAWFLTPADSPLSDCERAMLINKLFLKDETILPDEAANAKVVTELDSLDLVVLLSSGTLIAVENKMKSRQGVGQLEKYSSEIVELKKAIGWSGKKDVKIFLTFSGEPPLSSGEPPLPEWRAVDYQDVGDALGELRSKDMYLKDYLTLLKKMLECRKAFLSKHSSHLQIFARSGMKIRDRLSNPLGPGATDVEKFVCGNKLERLFVERLFRDVSTKVNPKGNWVSESRGKALIHVNLFRFSLQGSPNEFRAAFQFQGDTLKLNIGALDYDNSKLDWLSKESSKAFDDVLDNDHRTANAARTKAYRSWSWNLSQEDHPKNKSFDKFVEWLELNVKDAIQVWTKALEKLREKGVVVKFSPET